MDVMKALKILQLRQHPGVLTRVAKRLKLSVQFVSDVYYGKMRSRNRRVERLARRGRDPSPYDHPASDDAR